jgi:hypothetical protein
MAGAPRPRLSLRRHGFVAAEASENTEPSLYLLLAGRLQADQGGSQPDIFVFRDAHIVVGHHLHPLDPRISQKYLNKTPTEYTNSLRLDFSISLLLQTDEKVIDVSLDAGFESLRYFY